MSPKCLFSKICKERVDEVEGNWIVIVILCVALIASGLGHSITYFQLMGTVGAVSTGILQSLRSGNYFERNHSIFDRAVSVFVISSILFCNQHEEQCFNGYKSVSVICVILGVLYFIRINGKFK